MGNHRRSAPDAGRPPQDVWRCKPRPRRAGQRSRNGNRPQDGRRMRRSRSRQGGRFRSQTVGAPASFGAPPPSATQQPASPEGTGRGARSWQALCLTLPACLSSASAQGHPSLMRVLISAAMDALCTTAGSAGATPRACRWNG